MSVRSRPARVPAAEAHDATDSSETGGGQAGRGSVRDVVVCVILHKYTQTDITITIQVHVETNCEAPKIASMLDDSLRYLSST